MRLSQAGFTTLLTIIILFGLALVYYRGLVADVHSVGTEASRFVGALQLRPNTYAQ